MDWTQIIITAISVIFAGGVGAFLNYKLNNKKEDASQFTILIQEYKELREKDYLELKELKERLIKLEEREKELLLEIQSLKSKLLIFEGSHSDIPLPSWLKDTNGKMIFLNKEYEDLFLIPNGFTIDDYIGNDDYAIWGNDIADHFLVHDKHIMRNKKAQRFIEKTVVGGITIWLEVLKYPRKLNNNVIGIGGIMLRMSKKEIVLDDNI